MLATRLARILHIDPVLRNHDPGLREFLIARFMWIIGASRTNRAWQLSVAACGRALRWTGKRNFLVLSAARSGTTLLVDYLNCHRSVRCRSEILNPDYETYGNPRRMNRHRLRLHVAANFVKPPHLWAGAKILTYQLDELDIALTDLLEVLQRPRVIVLYRMHVIEQYLSFKVAEHADLWHSTQETNGCSIPLDLETFRAFAQREHRMWRTNILSLGDCPVHYMTYEELCADPAASMRNVFGFLELEPCPVRTKFLKLNPGPLAQRLTNYQEFARAGLLESTRLDLPRQFVHSSARVA